MKEVFYLQREFNGLPAGLPLERTEPTSAHYQARAMVGPDVVPTGYYRPYGIEGDKEVLAIPLFEGIIGNLHPKDPKVVGPFVAGKVTIDYDRLPADMFCNIVYIKDHPYVNAFVCINNSFVKVDNTAKIRIEGTDTIIGGSVVYPVVYGVDILQSKVYDTIFKETGVNLLDLDFTVV